MTAGKRSIADLALFGGQPLFAETLHVGRPNVGDREALFRRWGEMLDRNWLTNDGPLVRELEARIAKYLGVRHCVAMCNGTVALEIAIRALELEGEVIVPSFTFIATAHALWWQGIRPVFCDIDPETHCLDPAKVEAAITDRTTGILGVHVWGRPCAVEELERIAAERGLRLLFDAAHAFGVSHRGRMIGSFGRCEVLSFHATKFFNTMEGGAVVTDDDELAQKMRLMRNFGFAGMDRVIYIGTNGKMSEASAAMGLTNLEALEQVIAFNRQSFEAYSGGLKSVLGLRLLGYPANELSNFQYVVFEVDETFGIERDDLLEILHAENVRARRYFWPGCHRMEPYSSVEFGAEGALIATEAVGSRVLVLPTGGDCGASRARAVCEVLAWIQRNGCAVAEALKARARVDLTGSRSPQARWAR